MGTSSIERTLMSGLRNALGDAIEIRIQLVVGLDDRIFFFGAHVEADHQHAQPGWLMEYTYSTPGTSRSSRSMGMVARCCTSAGEAPGHLHENVEHGHNDLWLFFAGSHQDREGARQQCARDEQRRQL